MSAGYYIYKGTYELGQEPLGSDNRLIRRDLKTDRGAIAYAKRIFKDQPFSVFRFSNFYDDRSFRVVYRQLGKSQNSL